MSLPSPNASLPQKSATPWAAGFAIVLFCLSYESLILLIMIWAIEKREMAMHEL